MALRTPHLQLAAEINPKNAESAARAALEQLAQHELTDAEWQRDRLVLLQYALILRRWRKQVGVTKPTGEDALMSGGEVATTDSVLGKAA
jgi:hypothetical protein